VEAIELEALAALFKYPATHFLEGSLDEPPSVRALAHEAANLTERDREEVLRFARFVKAYGHRRPSIADTVSEVSR